MKALVIRGVSAFSENMAPLVPVDLPVPSPADDEILIRVRTCGVCHTEIDEIEGRTPPPRYPIVPGHEVVGIVEERGAIVTTLSCGDRVGVGWIHSACGACPYCRRGEENLCPSFCATGRDANGGYAEYMTVPASFAYPIPDIFSDTEAAPLLCAGAIGYRSLRLAAIKDGDLLGLTGFGASAHLVLKMTRCLYPSTPVFVFARSESERRFARELGAVWSGDTAASSPEKLHAVIDTTPAWKPVVCALTNLEPGGRLVINAIRKNDADKKTLLDMDYSSHLWLEKEIKSVANVTRKDISEFLAIAARIPIKSVVQAFSLDQANEALLELTDQKIRGGKVLVIDSGSGTGSESP